MLNIEPMDNQLQDLRIAGQSVWLDNINRDLFTSGRLHSLIAIGLRGMTSNPTIFEKAIDSGSSYESQLALLSGRGYDAQTLLEALAVQDIRTACDVFRPVYDATNGLDGYVSLEVPPTLAHDTSGTTAAAARLWDLVKRPNVMIKIPGTPECFESIRASIAKGININVTLLFSVSQYARAAEAYITGIEDRVRIGDPVDSIASVASVFVSRIDTLIDKEIDQRGTTGKSGLARLKGKAGVANLKLTYEKFQGLFRSPRFRSLNARGARVQRPLWASTSTKNPAYNDLMYVESVVGPDTVNTMPFQTLDALLDHGAIKPNTIDAALSDAHSTLETLAAAGIIIDDVGKQLVIDGVAAFAKSYEELLNAIDAKSSKLGEKIESDS
jgi:transaldolase